VSGARRAQAERRERSARPLRIVAVVFLALVVLGAIGAAFVDDDDAIEVVNTEGHHEEQTFDFSVSPVTLVGFTMISAGMGLLVYVAILYGGWSLFWATSPPRRAKRRPAGPGVVATWATWLGVGLVLLGVFVTFVGGAID
jgi:heme A synthase